MPKLIVRHVNSVKKLKSTSKTSRISFTVKYEEERRATSPGKVGKTTVKSIADRVAAKIVLDRVRSTRATELAQVFADK